MKLEHIFLLIDWGNFDQAVKLKLQVNAELEPSLADNKVFQEIDSDSEDKGARTQAAVRIQCVWRGVEQRQKILKRQKILRALQDLKQSWLQSVQWVRDGVLDSAPSAEGERKEL